MKGFLFDLASLEFSLTYPTLLNPGFHSPRKIWVKTRLHEQTEEPLWPFAFLTSSFMHFRNQGSVHTLTRQIFLEIESLDWISYEKQNICGKETLTFQNCNGFDLLSSIQEIVQCSAWLSKEGTCDDLNDQLLVLRLAKMPGHQTQLNPLKLSDPLLAASLYNSFQSRSPKLIIHLQQLYSRCDEYASFLFVIRSSPVMSYEVDICCHDHTLRIIKARILSHRVHAQATRCRAWIYHAAAPEFQWEKQKRKRIEGQCAALRSSDIVLSAFLHFFSIAWMTCGWSTAFPYNITMDNNTSNDLLIKIHSQIIYRVSLIKVRLIGLPSRTLPSQIQPIFFQESNANVDSFAVAVGQTVASKFKMLSLGLHRLQIAVKTLSYTVAIREVLQFGFGINHVIRNLVQTTGGATFIMLCSALSETRSSILSARVLFDLAKTYFIVHQARKRQG